MAPNFCAQKRVAAHSMCTTSPAKHAITNPLSASTSFRANSKVGFVMSFNTDKCVALRLHLQQAKNSNPHYELNGNFLDA